jgi:two-component system, chemotaxis family, chemotaxis protein CheY
MDKPRILSVGQCSFDHGSITRHLGEIYGAEVAGADTKGQALATLRAGEFDLVLVNRVLDFDGTSGFDLIRAIKADPELAGVPVMLVSNYESAQSEAQSLGALPGFGKTDLRHGAVPALEILLARPV